jgi:hypothetical protein
VKVEGSEASRGDKQTSDRRFALLFLVSVLVAYAFAAFAIYSLIQAIT